MKRFLLAALAVATLAGGTAEAADMGAPPPPPVRKVAPPVVIYSWSGPYWGVNVGYSWGRLSNDWTVSGLAVGSASETQDLNGVIGGFQSGINWQVGAWLFGMEADIQATGQKGATTYCLVSCDVASVAADHKLPWLGTARSRVGFLPTDSILVYATYGIAYGQVRSDYTFSAGGVAFGSAELKDTRAGWTAGAGIEGAFGGSWSAKLEYLYVDLGKRTETIALAGVTTASWDHRVTDHIARVGLNYRWGAAPVVASY